jgi:hypothetical protein
VKKRLKCAFLWHGLENTGLSPTTTFGRNCFSGSLLKMVKRRNLTVNDHQKLKDFLLERFENGHLRRGQSCKVQFWCPLPVEWFQDYGNNGL